MGFESSWLNGLQLRRGVAGCGGRAGLVGGERVFAVGMWFEDFSAGVLCVGFYCVVGLGDDGNGLGWESW